MADFDHNGLTGIAYGDRDSTDVGAPGVVVLLHNDAAQPGRLVERQRQMLAVHAFAAFALDMNRDGWPDPLAGPMGALQGRLAWLCQNPTLPGALLAPVLLP